MLIDDIDRSEWGVLCERPELESEVRQFLLQPNAASVVAVTCASRIEMFGIPELDAGPGRELRFRNPSHPAAASRCWPLQSDRSLVMNSTIKRRPS